MDVTRRGDFLPKAPGHFIESNIFAINLYQCVRCSSQIIPCRKNMFYLNHVKSCLIKFKILFMDYDNDNSTYQGIFTET